MGNDLYSELGPRLAGLRQKRGLSQRALAERLSVTRQAVSNWERGATIPDVATLCRIGEVLGADWNELLGSTPPPPKKRIPVRQIAALSLAGALLIGAALWAGTAQIRTREDNGPSDVQGTGAPLSTQTVPLEKDVHFYEHEFAESIRAEPSEAAPISPLRQSAAQLSQLLNTITQTGEIELTSGADLTKDLRNAFSAAGEDCLFRFLPAYEDGVFDDPNMVLTWLYRSGHSRGNAFTTEQVDAWLADWFDSSVQWSHVSTEDYPLSDGVYIPHSCWVHVPGCYLERLEHREDGSFWAELTVGGSRATNSGRILTIVFTAEERGPRFSYVGWSHPL